MTNPNCDVCCGRGKIRVRIYPRVSVVEFDPRESMSTRESSREYPCPECSEVVPVERLTVVKRELFIDSRVDDPRYIESCKHHMAHQLIDDLIRQELVKFERGPTDTTQMRFGMRMSVGVVAPSQVATLAERVEQHQEALAREVMAEAARSINHWGSYYGTATLAKAQAVDSVHGALRTVLDARKKWKAA